MTMKSTYTQLYPMSCKLTSNNKTHDIKKMTTKRNNITNSQYINVLFWQLKQYIQIINKNINFYSEVHSPLFGIGL